MLRITRQNKSRFTPVGQQMNNPWPEHSRLVLLIKKHLSPGTASVLATPTPSTGDEIEWTTDLSGQPVRLDALPAKEQAEARNLLKDRLASIAKLADELPRVNPDAIDLQDTLRQAVAYPGDDSVYVVNGQPVVTFWGHRNIDSPDPVLGPVATPIAPDPTPRKMPRFPWRPLLSAGAVLAALALLAWLWLQYQETADNYAQLRNQIDAAAGQCGRLEEILESNPFLQEPEGKFATLKLDLMDKIKTCKEDAAYRDLLAQIEAAAGQCEMLEQILATNPLLQQPEERYEALKQKLTEQIKVCKEDAAYRDLFAQIEAAAGQCETLEQILATNPLLQRPEERYGALKQKLTEQIKACNEDKAYRQLLAQIEAASDQCELLEEILNTNPLLQQPAGRYSEIRQKLTEQIKTCKGNLSYRNLVRQIEAAAGNCAELEKILNTDPSLQKPEGRFIELKQQLTESTQQCKRNADLKDLQRDIEQSISQCNKLETILASDRRLQNPEGQYLAVKEQLKKQIEACQASQKKDPAQLCPGERPVQLAPELVVLFDASRSMGWPMGTTPESQRLRKQGENILKQRPPNPILANLANIQAGILYDRALAIDQQKFGASNTRIVAAKNALSKMVTTVPSDVSTGLVVLTDCPSAQKVGFYPPQNRNRFVRDINSLATYGGTPLGDGLNKAGQMIDGVNKPSTIVIISDGEESCGGNPCAIARSLAARKPQLTINVVDILGTGAGNCLAGATRKGQVFTARNVKDIVKLTEKAGSSVAAPEHCKKP